MTTDHEEPLLQSEGSEEARGRDETQTHKPTWNLLTTSLLLRWEGLNKKDMENHGNLKKKKKRKALSYFLASTWQNWMKRIAGRGVGHRLIWREQREEAPDPLVSLTRFPFRLQVTECDNGHTWDFLTVFWPPPPSIALPWGSHFNWPSIYLAQNEGSMFSYAYWTECKKKKTKELYLQTSVSQPLQGLF